MKKFYLLIVWFDVEPQLRGPYKTEKHRLAAARRFRRREDEGNEHGIFKITTRSILAHHDLRLSVDFFRGMDLDPEET